MPTISEQLVTEAQANNLPIPDVATFWAVVNRGLVATQADQITTLRTAAEAHAQTLLAPLQLELNAVLVRRQAAIDILGDLAAQLASGASVTLPTEADLIALINGDE